LTSYIPGIPIKNRLPEEKQNKPAEMLNVLPCIPIPHGEQMEYGRLISESYEYAKQALWGRWERWLLLIMSVFIFPLILGYIARIYRGEQPAPRFEEGGLFINGLKLFFAGLIYAIPVIIIIFTTIGITMLPLIPAITTRNWDNLLAQQGFVTTLLIGLFIGLAIALILSMIISLISTIGLVRLARTERFGEGFNLSEIAAQIHRIGWWPYIAAVIILWIISFVYIFIIELFLIVPVIGWIVLLITLPPFILFEARYITLVYNEGLPVIAQDQG
jgi:hypothetical protein